jgi:hypothetical protein
MTDISTIRLRHSTVDGHSEEKTFFSVTEAQRFAHHWIGPHPEIGRGYAVSGDGIGKIEARGITLAALFPVPGSAEPAS